MDLLNTKVKHATFGSGVVTAVDDTYIIIQFASKKSKFMRSDAFEKFIQAEDPEIHEAILKSMAEAKQAAEEQHQAKLAAHKSEEDRRSAEANTKQATLSQGIGYVSKPATSSQRIEGRRMTFFVFQGNTFNKEYQGGYIWAPISNKAGTLPHHWTRLLDVRKGDIIIHGCGGFVQAISVARDVCYESKQPIELTVEDLWDQDGRRIDCDYTLINRPIKTSAFTNEIISFCNVKYSPFDKDGNGNMGYLFEINRQLARIFINASVKQNPYLNSVYYINELLLEGNND